jgi:hypothetical protein
MIDREAWEQAGRDFWAEVEKELEEAQDPMVRGNARRLIDEYRDLLKRHGVDDGLIYHRGVETTARAVAAQADQSEPDT